MALEKILAVATHPDDEVLGMGGTLLNHVSKGDEVYVCIVSSVWEPKWGKEDVETRKAESYKASKYLGAKKLFRLDYPSLRLHTIPIDEIIDSITRVIEEVKPSIVYTNYKADINIDHGIVFQAVSIASRPISGVKQLLSAETPSETDLALPLPDNYFHPNFYVNIEKELENKINAAKIYKSEMKTFPHLRSEEAIRAMAAKRGAEANINAAEAFFILRYIK